MAYRPAWPELHVSNGVQPPPPMGVPSVDIVQGAKCIAQSLSLVLTIQAPLLFEWPVVTVPNIQSNHSPSIEPQRSSPSSAWCPSPPFPDHRHGQLLLDTALPRFHAPARRPRASPSPAPISDVRAHDGILSQDLEAETQYLGLNPSPSQLEKA